MQTDPLATLRGHAVMNAQRLNLAAVQGRKVFDGSEGHDSGRLTKKLMTGHKEQLVDRLVERVKRIERVQIQQPTLAKAASRPRESAPVQAPPVPRLFRRQGAAMPNPTPTVPSETVYFPQDYRASNGRRPGKNGDFDTALTNLDVNNLTDQIVRNIDQRVIAYRERRGKI